MKSLSDKIFTKIKSEKIQPRPAWQFRIKKLLFWLMAVLATLVSGLSIGLVAHSAASQDWTIYSDNRFLFSSELISDIPYFWLLAVIIALVIAYLIIRQSNTGYRYSGIFIIVCCFLTSLIIGSTLFATGASRVVDTTLNNDFPAYNSVNDQLIKNWSQPNNGYLGGIILSQAGQTIKLQDFKGKVWQINLDNLKIPTNSKEFIGEKVRIVGRETDQNDFKAQVIYVWNNCKALFSANACD
jgi:hypothetical protein